LYIALAIVLGLLIVLVIAVLQGQISETQELAAIFSGWVTSIVAFYFYGQSNAQAQTQINNSAQDKAKSDQRATTAETKLNSVKAQGLAQIAAHNAHTAATRAVTPPSPSDQVLENIKNLLETI
jgi:hypothetical protein